jgi:hypothetical protein
MKQKLNQFSNEHNAMDSRAFSPFFMRFPKHAETSCVEQHSNRIIAQSSTDINLLQSVRCIEKKMQGNYLNDALHAPNFVLLHNNL